MGASMEWILIAITMAASGQPTEYRQVASFEDRAVCEYAPEALRTRPIDTSASSVVGEGGQWVVQFRCVPSTKHALVEELDAQDAAAMFLAGKGEYTGPWWQKRLDKRRTSGTK